MQKLTKISLIASVLLWCYSCQTPQSSSTPPHKATSAAMKIATRNKTTVTNFFTALETKNLEKLVSLFADDAQHINPYHSDIFPRGAIGKEEIASYWKPVFPAINSMRFVIEEMYTLESPTSLFVKFKGAIDFLNTTDVYTNQYYATFTFNSRGEILEYVEIFNPIPAAKAFGLSVATKTSNTMKQQIIPVQFNSEGLRIKGNLFLPKNYEKGKKYPTIISVGSWTTVKEQMAGLYAKRFAEQGFISLAFDFRNFGESEGLPRAWENPTMKIKDIQNAVSFLQTLPEVATDNIGIFGVCAGSMYALMATAETPSIKAVATTASWLHDAEAVTLFYGGEAGVQEKIKAAQRAKKHYAETGDIAYIKAISTTDSTAAMYGEFDYYLNPSRGAVKQWDPNQFALASWEDWLTLDPFPTAAQIQQPVLMIHSDGCVLPDYTKKYFEELQSSDKELLWVPTTLASPMHQFNFYDQEPEVSLAAEKTSNFFHQKLR